MKRGKSVMGPGHRSQNPQLSSSSPLALLNCPLTLVAQGIALAGPTQVYSDNRGPCQT